MMRYHEDERRKAYCNLFEGTPGDVNLFIVNPGQRTCWHRHQKQVDQFRVLSGKIRFGLIEGGVARYYVMDKPGWSLSVPTNTWHGYENISDQPAMLLMYLSEKYNPEDEERMNETEHPWHPPT